MVKKAKIVGFKRNHSRTYNNYCILALKEKEKDLGKFIGRKIFWITQTGKRIKGKILRIHGKDLLMARFNKGLPGNAIGSEIDVY